MVMWWYWDGMVALIKKLISIYLENLFFVRVIYEL